MEHNESTFVARDGLKLYYQTWQPPTAARAALAIVHGLGEHSGRYMRIVNCLVPSGYAVYGFDLRGHGRSPGQRGYITKWSEYREDVRAFVERIAEQAPHLPLFLMGHSLGGLIVLNYALHYPDRLKGVIASAPAVGKVGISPVLFLLSRILSRVYPRFSLKTGLEVAALSRDPKVVQAYIDDPLVHSLGTPRLATEVIAAQQWTMEHAPDLRVPLLIIHGAADRLTAPESSRAFFERVIFPDKQRIVYPDAYHECHNDLCGAQVAADIERWLAGHVYRG